jgi:hypothetical protein
MIMSLYIKIITMLRDISVTERAGRTLHVLVAEYSFGQ